MSGVLDAYLDHCVERGLRPKTITTLRYRLKGITQVVARDRLLSSVSPALARELYVKRCADTVADTHRAELAAAQAMFGWCIDQGWLAANPFAAVNPVGRKAVRKDHLRIDEARAFRRAALDDATDAGLAAAMLLLMGLRVSEVTERRVRDIDDGARVLWVDGAKTDAGDRHLEVPAELRARLLRKVQGRPADDRLFGDVSRRWLAYHVGRLCGLAKIQVVSPHALRRTWSAIGAESMPVDAVSRALGHASAAITRRHYQPTNAEERRSAGAVLRSLDGSDR